jgi:hypothetical protein
MSLVRLLLCVALAAAAAAAAAQDVQRCEGADGKISYANGPCPAGTTATRSLPPAGSPSAAEQKAAQQRAQQDARRAAEVDRARKAEDERLAREQEKEQARAKKLEAQCRRLQSRLDAAQQDYVNASPKQRVEAQRRLRRAEQLYVDDCGPVKK